MNKNEVVHTGICTGAKFNYKSERISCISDILKDDFSEIFTFLLNRGIDPNLTIYHNKITNMNCDCQGNFKSNIIIKKYSLIEYAILKKQFSIIKILLEFKSNIKIWANITEYKKDDFLELLELMLLSSKNITEKISFIEENFLNIGKNLTKEIIHLLANSSIPEDLILGLIINKNSVQMLNFYIQNSKFDFGKMDQLLFMINSKIKFELVDILIKKGVPINKKGNNGITGFEHLINIYGSDISYYLLDNGADINLIQDKLLLYKLKKENNEIIKLKKQIKILKKELSNVKKTNLSKQTPTTT